MVDLDWEMLHSFPQWVYRNRYIIAGGIFENVSVNWCNSCTRSFQTVLSNLNVIESPFHMQKSSFI